MGLLQYILPKMQWLLSSFFTQFSGKGISKALFFAFNEKILFYKNYKKDALELSKTSSDVYFR